jgi:hypothetical protein
MGRVASGFMVYLSLSKGAVMPAGPTKISFMARYLQSFLAVMVAETGQNVFLHHLS